MPTDTRIADLMRRAAGVPAGERAAFLDAACAGDAELRARVEALLLQETGEFAAHTGEAEGAHAVIGEGPGTVIGRYKLVSLLGEGGFGSVFMAEQEQPVRRRVALKIIKLGMDTRQVVARFEQERQALAVMDHPNIAKVLDAGATDTGRPYFVMELVKGEPITAYCDRQKLSVPERLGLFIQVCQAVQHAHHKGVIHRDLKPGNVLVSTHEGAALAKVIDFGIAKAADYRMTEKTIFTEHRQLIGTPAYMSPEQAEGSQDIDTRTDVYSLGVLLYELLTGSTPFDSRSLRSAAYAEIQRIIREVEPPKPSTRVAGASGEGAGNVAASGATSAEIAKQRRVEPRKLTTMLRGDLDWVVMKALEKDRRRRYDSPAALALDVEHYLKDEPVTAGPPSAAYRMRKFVRRHRAGAVVAVVFAATLVAGLIATSVMYQRADAQRRLAEAESAKVKAAYEFVSGMFGSIDPAVAKGRDVTVREVLDSAAAKVDAAKPPPEVEGNIREAIGEAYHHIAKYADAERNLKRAAELRTQALGADDPETLTSLFNMGASMLEQDRAKEAIGVIRQTAEAREKRLGETHADTLASKSLLAYATQLTGDLAGAETAIRSVIAAQTKALGATHKDTIESRNSLADILHDEGKLEEAAVTAKEVSADAAKVLGEDAPLTMDARSIHGAILKDLGKESEAEPVLRAVVAAKTRVYGADKPGTLLSEDILANTLRAQNKLEEAERLERSIVERAKKVNGPEHTATLTYMNNLAQTLRLQKKFDEAEPIYRAVLEARKRDGPTQQNLITTYNLGLLKMDQGKPAEAIPLFEEAIAGFEKNLKPTHWMVGATRASVGDALVALGKFDEAEAAIQKGYDLVVGGLGEKHWRAQKVAQSAVNLYEKWGRAEKAAEWKARTGASDRSAPK